MVSRSMRAKARSAAIDLVEAVVGERLGERLAEHLPPLLEQEQRDRLRRQQRGMHDQRLDRGMQLAGLLDGEREGLRHRQAVVILGRRVARVVEQSRRRRLETLAVVVERLLQPLAIGGRLLMGERQPAQRLRQGLRGGALVGAAGARHQIVGAGRLGPDADRDRRGDPAPSLRVRGDQHLAAAAARQVGLERVGIRRIVEDEQDAFALVPQPLHHHRKRRRLLVVGADPAEPHPERHQIGAHAGLGLRPDPPGRPVVAAIELRVGGRERGLADAAHAMQRRDGAEPRPSLACRGGVLSAAAMAASSASRPMKWVGTRIGMLETANTWPGKAALCGAARLAHEFLEARARRLLGHAVELAAADVIDQRRQPARLHHHEQHEAGAVLGRLPQRRVALQRRVGGLEVLVRHHAEHVIGGVVARLHPGVDVVAALDLPFVDVGRVGEGLELLADPLRPVAVAAGIGDEIVRHQPQSRAGPLRTGRNPHDRRRAERAQAGARLPDSCAALLTAPFNPRHD